MPKTSSDLDSNEQFFLKRTVIDCRTMRNVMWMCFTLAGVCLVILLLHLDTSAQLGGGADPVLLVANQGDRSLSIIDPVAGRQVAVVPEGGVTGHEVVGSPDGRNAFVPIYGDSGVGKPGSDGSNMVVINIANHKVIGNVDFGHGVRPHCVVYDPNSGMLYVTTELDKTVTIVDPQTLKIVGTIPTTQQSLTCLSFRTTDAAVTPLMLVPELSPYWT
jgi:hypothetical protein